MTRWFLLTIVISAALIAKAQKFTAFPPSKVELTGGVFLNARNTDLHYIKELDADRLLAPFRIDAGIPHEAQPYPNWENGGLNGHIAGHYLSALAWMYAQTGDPWVSSRLKYMVDVLEECQQKNGNGYVGGIPDAKQMWTDIAKGKIEADFFSLNGKWVPLYNIHKTFAGLRDAYVVGKNEKARDVLLTLSDWFYRTVGHLSDDQLQTLLKSEHGGLNEVFADVYAISGDVQYRDLAVRLSHRRILTPLLKNEDQLTGLHANTQIPKVIGFARIAEVSGDTALRNAASFFWKNVVEQRTVSIGGNSVREHFHPVDDFSQMLESNQGPETCNTYNMLRLSKLLFLAEGKTEYLDYYERATYNHILSSQHPEKGGFVYFTPMRPNHYRVYSDPQKSFWCCVGSGLENHTHYNEMIYTHNGGDIYVNLFIPSLLRWNERKITLRQETSFPFEEKSVITVVSTSRDKYSINIRRPSWSAVNRFAVAVNGKPVKIDFSSDYVTIWRKWKSGDTIEISLPMSTRAEFLPDGSPWVSFVHGPIVLAAPTDTVGLSGLRADDSRMGHVAEGPMYPVESAPGIIDDGGVIEGKVRMIDGQSLTFELSSSEKAPIRLVPFASVHDSRYMIYWPVLKKDEVEKRRHELQEREAFARKLKEETVDYVASGEQQPEADHFYKGEQSEGGLTGDHHWRRTTRWFSYELKNRGSEGRVVRVTILGENPLPKFRLTVNGVTLQTDLPQTLNQDQSYHLSFQLPAEVLSAPNGKLVTRIESEGESATPRIVEVRLMK
jgi:uncharacterized protein